MAKTQLEAFGADVDRFLSDPESAVPPGAKRYAAAVERAATDVANRRTRLWELDAVMHELWPDLEPLKPPEEAPTEDGGPT